MGEELRQAGSDLALANETLLHPFGLALVVVCGLIMLAVPRRYAIWPMLVMACFVSAAQRLVVFGLDFNMLRIMVLFGAVRIFSRNEGSQLRLNTLDKLLIAWVIVQTMAYTVLLGSFGAFVTRLGKSFDAVGMYFVFRCLVRDWADLEYAIRGFMWISLPVFVAFVVERSTGRNPFSVFGGVPAVTLVREGRLRCQGAYPHAIIAGSFWGTMLPMMVAMWWRAPKLKLLIIASVFACIFIVFASASSTPVLAVLAGAMGAGMYRFRRYMRKFRYGVLFTLIALHFMMRAPVWHLIARVSAVGGSTGYHRYKLIDQAIRHVGEWWFVGVRSTAHWGWGMQDVANQYVFQAVTGGIASLVIFIAILVVAFRYVGNALDAYEENKALRILSWSIGVSLFVHCMVFIGLAYFGQIVLVWYFALAVCGSLGAPAEVKKAIRQVQNRRSARMADHHAFVMPARRPG